MAAREATAREEVEQAFITYFRTGGVGEDWDGFADLFTEDAVYIEHVLGNMQGREEIRTWINSVMNEYPEIYTAYEWHQIEGDRVVFYMQNRRDNPDPNGPPTIDFPGISVLHYAGNGKWSYEEDLWAFPASIEASKQYEAACKRFDPEHPQKRTRLNWPSSPSWARP
jgi:ketosteroid isomerase-like protein